MGVSWDEVTAFCDWEQLQRAVAEQMSSQVVGWRLVEFFPIWPLFGHKALVFGEREKVLLIAGAEFSFYPADLCIAKFLAIGFAPSLNQIRLCPSLTAKSASFP